MRWDHILMIMRMRKSFKGKKTEALMSLSRQLKETCKHFYLICLFWKVCNKAI